MTETALQKVERMEHLAKLRAWKQITDLIARGDEKTAELVRINQLPRGPHIDLALAAVKMMTADELITNSRRLRDAIRGIA